MRETVEDLAWLLPPANDFRQQCREIGPDAAEPGLELWRLANHRLDINQLAQLARALDRVSGAGNSLRPLTPVRLAILSNATVSLLIPALRASALRHGLALEVFEAPFGSIAQEALDPTSATNLWKPDIVLVALDHRGLPLAESLNDQRSQSAVAQSLALIETVRSALRENAGATTIVQTVPAVPMRVFGSFDAVQKGTFARSLDQLNQRLADTIPGSGDILFDVASLAASVGLYRWHDPVTWNHGKLPFDPHFIPLHAEHLCRLIAAHRGKSRRCLVLDLDNTLWGGVVGDDGVDGIVLGNGSAAGEAFLTVQETALRLRNRGIVLAVCSKNNEPIAREPFERHPEMLIREKHIACFRANWDDKATNLTEIARQLDLGLDSFVFLDDNPAERALVRRYLPQVAVPELPSDPSLYAVTLLAAGYFEAIGYSAEDALRAESYQANAARKKMAGSVGDLNSYLESLEMAIHFAPFNETGRSRISQLINKSNQFNLTTRRYSEAQVAALQQAPDAFTLQVRLTDVFGDNGMISVIVCRPVGSDWEIDTWLMSCRVLKRRVEEAVLHEIVHHAREAGVKALIGRYLPTARNGMVSDHYKSLQFEQIEELPGGGTVWRLEVGAVEDIKLPMRVVREGFVHHIPAAATAP